jgi:hypothetical protein
VFGQLAAAPAAPSPAPPKGKVGTAYGHTFTSSTGTPAGSFVVSAGELPPGLSLSPAGVLSDTPTTVGDYTFTVTASNDLFADAGQQFTLTVSSNTAPTVTDDAYSTDEDATLEVSATKGVLANDTDVDNNTLMAFMTGGPSKYQGTAEASFGETSDPAPGQYGAGRPLVGVSGRTRQNTNYVQLDKPVPLCNSSFHLRAKRARTFEDGLENGAEEGFGLDAQDLTPARSAHPPASIYGSRTLRPTTN